MLSWLWLPCLSLHCLFLSHSFFFCFCLSTLTWWRRSNEQTLQISFSIYSTGTADRFWLKDSNSVFEAGRAVLCCNGIFRQSPQCEVGWVKSAGRPISLKASINILCVWSKSCKADQWWLIFRDNTRGWTLLFSGTHWFSIVYWRFLLKTHTQ